MKKKKFIGLILFIIFVFHGKALSWTKETHMNLSEFAAENSVLNENKDNYLKNLGFDKGLMQELKWGEKNLFVRKWLAEGGNLEDKSDWGFPIISGATTRSFNHFHNPLRPWEQAGLDDTWTGESSLLWAQDGVNQMNFPGEDWSWQKVREYYYLALTSTTDLERQANFAKTFRGLGHQMHLIQDAAQPDHVRNDAHPEDTLSGVITPIGFEKWAGEKENIINSLASNPVFPTLSLDPSQYTLDSSYYTRNLVPSALFLDTDQYNGITPTTSLAQGIAEYTNANFFSDDTIFAAERYSVGHRHYFPFPRRESTDLQDYIDGVKPPETVTAEDGTTDTVIYISKVADGENISHFLRPMWVTRYIYNLFGEGSLFYKTFYRDNICHSDYASLLIPRAVGYSAGLLNYFFRGDIDIEPDTERGSGYVIVNNGDEEMEGTFELYYDNTAGERVKHWSGDYRISPSGKSENIAIFFPSDAAESGKFMLVFRGRMGAEEGAVVGREVNISSLIFFLVYSSEPEDVCNPAVQWKVIPYRIEGNGLVETEDQVNIDYDIYGTMPIVQSAPNGNRHYAITGNWATTVGAINERVPNKNATYYRWGNSISLCYGGFTGRIGARSAWRPDGLYPATSARRNYVLDNEGNYASLDYTTSAREIEKNHKFCMVSEYCQDIYLPALEWHIKYRREPDGEVVDGPVIAADEESGKWNESGYHWVRNNLIAALSPDKAVVHTVRRDSRENEVDLSVPFEVQVHKEIIRNGYYFCQSLGRHLQVKKKLEWNGTYHLGYRPIDDVTTETLKFGDVPIEAARLSKQGEKLPEFTYSGIGGGYSETLLYHAGQGHCEGQYDAADCIAEEGYCEVSSSLPEYNKRVDMEYKNSSGWTYCDGRAPYFPGVFYVPFTYKFTEQGDKNIRVMMYDNANVDETFIIFYSYDTEDWSYNQEGNDYDSVRSITTHFMKAVRKKGESVSRQEIGQRKKVGISSKHNGKIASVVHYSGTAISNVATQINGGVIAYTYTVSDLDDNGKGNFRERIVGVINYDNALLPVNYTRKFMLYDDSPALSGIDHNHRASIGIFNIAGK